MLTEATEPHLTSLWGPQILANSIPSYAALDLVLWCPEKAPTLFFPVPPPPNVSFAMRIERNVSINMGFGPATPRADTWLERRYETSFTIFLGRTRVVISARTIILPRVGLLWLLHSLFRGTRTRHHPSRSRAARAAHVFAADSAPRQPLTFVASSFLPWVTPR